MKQMFEYRFTKNNNIKEICKKKKKKRNRGVRVALGQAPKSFRLEHVYNYVIYKLS